MAKVQVTIDCEQATLELARAAGQLVTDIVIALKSGQSVLAEVETVGKAAILDLLPVASDFAQLPAEASEDFVAFMESWNVAGVETYKKLVAK